MCCCQGGADSDRDDLDLLLQRLQAARPPPEVMRAALKELKRLRQGGETQPGAASAQAYVELLADLPWNKLSTDPPAQTQLQQKELQPAGAGNSNVGRDWEAAGGIGSGDDGNGSHEGEGPSGAVTGGASSAIALPLTLQPWRPGADLDLREGRRLLDRAHFGLDKVKERIVQYLAVLRLRWGTAEGPVRMC